MDIPGVELISVQHTPLDAGMDIPGVELISIQYSPISTLNTSGLHVL